MRVPPDEGSSVEFMFVGPKTIGEEELASEGIAHKIILAGKMRRYFSLKNFIDVFKAPLGFLQSLWHLFVFMPNVIFSKGGYGSVPVVLAAWIFRIPVLIHESDATPGLANKFCAKFSKRIAISYMDSVQYFPEKKTALTGNPVRAGLYGGLKEEATRLFGLSGAKQIILILGGSQGAQPINDIVFASIPALISRCEVIHQCGPANYDSLKQLIAGQSYPGYFLFPFLNEEQMRHAYGAADLVVSRAGAGSIAEISALGKPSIIIPLPNAAADHQNKNAVEYARFGATLVLEQMNLTPHLFQNRIFALLDNTDLLAKMSANARTFKQEEAAAKIAQEILNIAKY